MVQKQEERQWRRELGVGNEGSGGSDRLCHQGNDGPGVYQDGCSVDGCDLTVDDGGG